MGFQIADYSVDVYIDDYDRGELDHVNGWTKFDLGFDLGRVFPSVSDLIWYVKDHDYTFRSCRPVVDSYYDGHGHIIFDSTVDKDNIPANDRLLELWRLGIIRLYSARGALTVNRVELQPVTAAELVELSGLLAV